MQLLRVIVYSRFKDEVCFSVTARNDQGQVIVGNTGYLPKVKASAAMDRLVADLGTTQAHVTFNPKIISTL